MENLIVLVMGAIVLTEARQICDGNVGVQWRGDPKDCSVFYMCVGDVMSQFRCSKGTVVDVYSKRCVKEGSAQDRCTYVTQNISTCQGGQTNLGVMSSCAKYIDCITSRRTGIVTERECLYPQLYDQVSGECRQPETVICGDRPEPKEPCDYDANKCKTAHCIPCRLRMPSCQGYPDGPNVWSGRERSPYYVVCKNDRVIFQNKCSGGKPQRFDPVLKKCVEYTPIIV
ncbi:uncharacterized protein LOC110460385 [Mizuhopecten yessoensis]|uniref:Chitin-binding type-2 domain-containing protein n=1 Tax=Mizuhopecten yessoensis TaxID=6573 RepID=A0A210Q2K1_MIZYE|nr:uncharacterized protein LOC110460385 [Mizuhopecten yessoensis]OWF42971.1 hypothetical protein KP79_PYT12120 [Mizuhopecten yessoensis]